MTVNTECRKCMPEETDVYATLTFPPMSKEDMAKLSQAELLLSEIGVEFDTSCGPYGRDWYLDWSLKGAILWKSKTTPEWIEEIRNRRKEHGADCPNDGDYIASLNGD